MSKLCVGPNVINSKQFKDAQSKYDLHESELEQIVHEWINTEGNEESFPSDDFIQSRIQGTSLLNASEDQIALWNEEYSIPKKFDTFDQAMAEKRNASKYFGENSIKIVQSNDGKFSIRVAEPIKFSDNPSMLNTVKRKAYNDIVEFSKRLGFEIKTQAEGDVVVDFANKIINISEVNSHTFNEIQAKIAAVLMPNDLRSEILSVGSKYGRGETQFIYEDILNAIENRDSWIREEPTLFTKIKKWLGELISKVLKNQLYYESLIDKAAKDVTNPGSEWYRQVIQEGFQQKTLDMERFKQSPLFNIYQAMTSLGAALDGSAAVRMQGTLFRKNEEDFHDLDFSKKFDDFSWDVQTELNEFFNNYKSATNNFMNKDSKVYSDLRKQMLENCTEHLKKSPIYEELSKYYSDIRVKHASKSKELGLLITLEVDGNPVDIFYGQNPIMHDIGGFRVADFSSSFSAKLIMGRDKDIRDIINFQKFSKPNPLQTTNPALKDMVETINRGRYVQQTEAQQAAERFNQGLSYRIYTTNHKEVTKMERSPKYIVSEVNKYNKTHDDKIRFNKKTQLVEAVNNPFVNTFDKPVEQLSTEKILENQITTDQMLEEGRQRDLVDYPFEDMDRGKYYMKGNSETFDNNPDRQQYVKLDTDFRNSILQHLNNDTFTGSKLSNETLIKLAQSLFDYFDRNEIQVLIVNKPADEASRGISSAASKALNQGVIFFQRQKGDNNYLVLLHELLHLATTDNLSFDSERRYLEENSQASRDLNNYYSAFVNSLEDNAEYRKYRSMIMRAKTQDELNAIPKWALDLYHATDSVGEFLSCAISYESVQNQLEKINVNNKSLLERIKDWMVDFVNKLFKTGRLDAEIVIRDIVDFLMTTNIDNVETSMASYMLEPSEFQAYVEDQKNRNAELWNSSLTYKEFQATKAIRQEMAIIKQQAIANGTFMKAPNGNPTNLTERQWLQVRTEAFLNWFGDWINFPDMASKVVDENGEPLVVYRGINDNNINKIFVYFTNDKNEARIYSEGLLTKGGTFFPNRKNILYAIREYLKYKLGVKYTNLDDASFTAEFSEDKNERIQADKDFNILNNDEEAKELFEIEYLISQTTLNEYNLTDAYTDPDYFENIDKLGKLLDKYSNKLNKYTKNYFSNIYEAFLNIRNPYLGEIKQEDLVNNERAYMYDNDGAFLLDGEHFLVKQGSQIKSATDNIGTFSGQYNSINRGREIIQKRKSLDIVKANETAKRAKEIGGIDTLRHPNAQGMHFGNPFTYLPNEVAKGRASVFQPTIRENVDSFEKWLRGTAFQDVEPERRQWIIDQVNSGALDNVPLVYYTTGARDTEGWHDYDYDTFPNHAHILLKLINEHIARKDEAMKGNELPEVKPVRVEIKDLNEHQKRFMEKQTKYLKQNKALEEAGLTSSEISEFAESVGFTLSDYITWAIEGKMENGLNENWVFDVFPTLKPADSQYMDVIRKRIKSMQRKEFVEYLGIGNLFAAVQEMYNSDENIFIDMLGGLDAISNNWDTIMRQAAITFNDNEDFSLILVSNDSEVKSQKNDENPDVDNYNESSEEGMIEDNGGNSLEYWQTVENTTDKFTKLSKLLKRTISNCLELDANKQPVTNVWGHQKRVALRPATEQIYNFSAGCRDLNEMIQMLEAHQSEAPWITQLTERLKDDTGKEAMFQSQFYTTFKVSDNIYSKGLTQKGKLTTIPVNRHPALNKVMRSLRTTFELGEHNLFTKNGVDKSSFELLKKNFDIFKSTLKQGGDIDTRNNALRTIVQLLVGETESSVVLTDFENNNISLEPKEIDNITNALNKIVETLQGEVNKGNSYYNPLNLDKNSNGIYGRLQEVFTPFLKKSESEISNTAYSNGKTFQTHVTPSWLSLFLERVNSPIGMEYLNQQYGASEFFKMNGVWRNWVLRQFMTAPEETRKKMFQHSVEVEFNKKAYMKDMNSLEYMLSLATKYFANQKDEMANYPMPMLGNKPSNEFISLPKIGGTFRRVGNNRYYTNSIIGENDVDVYIGPKSENSNELTATIIPMENTRTGTNIELWIDNVLIKQANANKDKTYKIRLDGFTDQNGLLNHSTFLNLLFSRNLPSNIKISEYDIERVVTEDQNSVIEALMSNFQQEISRIQTVRMREQAGIVKGTQGYIKYWDARGKEFQFLPIFNEYLNRNTAFGKELMNKIEGKVANDYVIEQEARKILLKDMLQRTEEIMDGWNKNGILQAMMKIKGVAENPLIAQEQFVEMIWNYKLVETNLLQLLAIDKAFFKNEEDLQKRMPQVHAPGARVHKWALAIGGKSNIYSVKGKVSADGLARTAMLNDIEGEAVKSNMLENIKEVFDRKLSTIDPNSEQYRIAKAQYAEIYKNFKEKIVLTDAQAYRSITGLRKVASMSGKWDEHKEEIYQRIVTGNYDFKDIQALSQVIKPFVFAQMLESTEVPNAPIKTMPVPMQNKNSEYLILLADAILAGEKTKRPNLLRVLNRIMEESAFDGRTYDIDGNVTNIGTYNGQGIDVIQFVSAVKCGEKGAMDLSSFLNMEEREGETAAYAYMKSMLWQHDDQNNILQTSKTYNPNSVRTFDFDYWSEQQEVDDHFLEHEQIDGSQKRAIIPSDLETHYADGRPVFYTFMDNGQQKMLNAEMFRMEYEQVYANKIEYGIQKLADEFKFNRGENAIYTRVDRNLAVSEILQNEVMNNFSRYGLDMLQAVSLDENYEFMIPLGDPVMYKRIEQLLNSMIKNRINKQMIEGGPVVQVSNFGTTTELSTRFLDKTDPEGKRTLPTLKEYQAEHPEKTIEDYKKEVLKKQGGMAYMEVFCSIYDEELMNFMDKDGFIDVKQIEAVNPDLLKLISYRIPTEDKYSILPLKIVGFLPREAGSAIMFPADITLITGSDFDIDKMYIQRKHFSWKTDIKRFKEDARSLLSLNFPELNAYDRNSEIQMFLNNPELMKNTDEVQAKLYELWTKNNYRTKVEFPDSGEKYLDNKMIDMTWSVLTNESTLDKMLNPGGFEREKLMGYKIAAFRTGEFESWSDLEGMSIDALKAVIDKNKKLDLTWIDTQIAFYEQNQAASTALGMAAVQKSAHALLEGDEIQIQVSEILKDRLPEGSTIQLADTEISGNMTIDGRADSNGILIGRTLGEFVAMFADAVKDPVANLMNINSQTMPIITALIRLGVPFEDAALFLSQPIIKDALDKVNYDNITGNYTTLNKVITQMIKDIAGDSFLETSAKLMSEPLTREEMLDTFKNNNRNTELKTLNMLKNFILISNEIKSLTTATRVNSIASAAGPLIIDNYIFENKLNDFSDYLLDKNENKLTLKSLYDNHPMLSKFAQVFYDEKLADKVFDYSPVNREFLDKCAGSMPMGRDKIFANRANLSSFVDFAYSYMAAKAGIVESGREKLDYYINKFPSEFIGENYKAKYPNNLFIQSIYRETQTLDDGSTMQVLGIGYTSLDETQKQKLRNGWYDLHKTNPELARKLYNYWFCRGGMTFNPRSGMALLAQQLRSIYYQYTDSTGKQRMLYKDKFEDTDYMTMMRQFFQNNANSYSLVPVKTIKSTDVIKISNDTKSLTSQFRNVRSNSGVVYAIKGDTKSDLYNVPAFRTKDDMNSLYFCIGERKMEGELCYIYEKVNALGNNGRYLEIDMSEINDAMKVSQISEVEKDTEVNPNSEFEAEDETKVEEPLDNLEHPDTKTEIKSIAEIIAASSEITGKPTTEAEKIENAVKSIIQEGVQLSLFDDSVEEMQKKVEENKKKLNDC